MHRIILMVVAIIAASSNVMADIEVEDGGYTISTTRACGKTAFVKRESFRIRGTGTDAQQALQIGIQKANERHAEFSSAMDRLIASEFVCPPYVMQRPCFAANLCPTSCPLGLPAGARQVTFSDLRWSADMATFVVCFEGKTLTFFVPAEHRSKYASKPSTLKGHLYNRCIGGKNLPVLWDSCNGVELLDP